MQSTRELIVLWEIGRQEGFGAANRTGDGLAADGQVVDTGAADSMAAEEHPRRPSSLVERIQTDGARRNRFVQERAHCRMLAVH